MNESNSGEGESGGDDESTEKESVEGESGNDINGEILKLTSFILNLMSKSCCPLSTRQKDKDLSQKPACKYIFSI